MQNFNDNEEISINELVNIIWKGKYLISSFIFLSALISILYALSLPNIYKSSAILAPVEQNESLSSKLGNYSALAGIAGVALPGENANPSLEAIERMKSFSFFTNHFMPNIKLEDLLAIDKWIPQENKLTYDSEIYNTNKQKWIRDVNFPKKVIPSDQEAYEEYKDILSIVEDKKTQFVTISIEHKSPYIAKDWLEIIIYKINESMREEDRQNAEDSINFLQDVAKKTNMTEIRESISNLLESQMKSLMLTSANKSYIYKTIDMPIAPETKSSPNRALICVLGTLIGALIGLIIVLVNFFRIKN